MLDRTRTALKYLTYGIAIGVLFAPRSGSETRAAIMEWVQSTIGGLLSGGGNQSR